MSPGVRAGNADLRKAQRHFNKGYWLKSSGSNHFIVMGPDGEPVRRNDGSGRHLGLPSSPRSSSISYHLRRLRDHGVLQQHSELDGAKEGQSQLVRDDLAEVDLAAPGANNIATKQLREDLSGVGITPPHKVRDYRELAEITSHIMDGEVTEDKVYGSAMKMYNGMTLTEKDREPFVRLLAILETEEDPIRTRFRLLRQAKNLPPQEEPVEEKPVQEEPVSTQDTTLLPMVMNAMTTEQIVREFISNIHEKVNEMMDEVNKLEDLRATLEEQYPSIKVEADDSQPGPAHSENGGVSRTMRVTPTPPAPAATKTEGRGRKFDPQEVMNLVAQGGEWTVKELAEGTGKAEPTISRALNTLIEEGKIVLVTPAAFGHGGRKPGTYGSAEHYQKS